MLPTFPKITEFRNRMNLKAIEHFYTQMSPMLQEIKRHIQFEGRDGKLVRYDGSVDNVEMKPASAEIELKRMLLQDFNERVLIGHLRNAAEQVARSISKDFYEKMDEVTHATGNVVDGKGKPFDEDLLLQALEKVEFVFNDDGTWSPPTLVTGKKVFETMSGKLPSDEFRRKLDKLVDRKRDEFRRREANRILAG